MTTMKRWNADTSEWEYLGFGNGEMLAHLTDISNPHAVTVEQIGAASKSDTTVTYYVYEDATGDEDGSSYANGFTNLQDAIDAAPDICDLVIYVRKGSTNYLGDTTTINKPGLKSLTISGEGYHCADCDANDVAGRIVDADADFTGLTAGDHVVITKHSGATASTRITEYLYTTIASVDSATQLTLTDSSKTSTTNWKYTINPVVFDGNNGSTYIIRSSDTNLIIDGICFYNSAYAIQMYNGTNAAIWNSIIRECLYGIYAGTGCGPGIVNRCSIISDVAGSYGIICDVVSDVFNVQYTTIAVKYAGLYDVFARSVGYCGIFKSDRGIWNPRNIQGTRLVASTIDSTVTYGVSGYNITNESGFNNATTPVTNLVSGGKVADVDIHGQTAETTIADDDELLMYDASATTNVRITMANLKTYLST